jgi:class 3 adenylate cyclase
MNPPGSPDPDAPGAIPARRRRLRAVLAADMANFGGMVAIDETRTLDAVWFTRRLASEELASHGGWLFGLPGDGIFALFESAVDAVRCALRIQARLAESPTMHALKLRIGVHLGDVLFKDELPFGEVLVIASRLESLAEPGGVLVSASVMDAVASHIVATFCESGVPRLKHSTRHIEAFRVLPPPSASEPRQAADLLDRTLAPEPASLRDPAPRPGPDAASAADRLSEATPLVLPTMTSARIGSPAAAPLSVAPVSAKILSAAPSETPATEDTPAKAISPNAATASLDDASLRRLALLLTTHLGPMASVLVRRKATESPDAAKLILMLAQEIPMEGERRKFLIQARAVMAGPN